MSQQNKLTRNNNKKKSLTNRGPSYKPSNTVTSQDVDKKSQNKVETDVVTEPIIDYKPKPTSIKVTTDTKDKVNALSLIGVGDTQLDVIESLIDYYIDGLPEEIERKYLSQYEVYRDKTIRIQTKTKK